ncbi:hypothetical protein QBC37DRAFT_421019 [Rhypophila decipiens]|uniref:Uncharacterized protein n=1 Tax=Rhypophila decipiens TaxID=261697 RepID=A0AAN6YED7_9PEZI|nr:hypothetical protein QBC37DRAFT_421019 [Rhypophila decipiens]
MDVTELQLDDWCDMKTEEAAREHILNACYKLRACLFPTTCDPPRAANTGPLTLRQQVEVIGAFIQIQCHITAATPRIIRSTNLDGLLKLIVNEWDGEPLRFKAKAMRLLQTCRGIFANTERKWIGTFVIVDRDVDDRAGEDDGGSCRRCRRRCVRAASYEGEYDEDDEEDKDAEGRDDSDDDDKCYEWTVVGEDAWLDDQDNRSTA